MEKPKNLDEIAYSGYQKAADSVLENFSSNISGLLEQQFDDKVPGLVRRHYQAEKGYLSDIASEIDDDLEELKAEKHARFREDPKALLKTTVQELTQFSDPERQERFMQRIQGGIEDSAYAAEVSAYEAYKIYEVKANTPGVRIAAKKWERNNYGDEGLPDISVYLDYINDQKRTATRMLHDLNDNLDIKVQERPRPTVLERYQERMPHPRKKALAMEYNERGREPPPQVHQMENYEPTRNEQFQTDLYYSLSSYNNILEKTVGVVGSSVNFATSVVSDIFYYALSFF